MGNTSIARYCGYRSGKSIKIVKKNLALERVPCSSLQSLSGPAAKMLVQRRVRVTLAKVQHDPIELEVFKHLFHSIAEEMGASLRRTAFSPNIKERRDYSCALFDADAQVLAMGDHMPVHLGSMPMSVHAAIADLALAPGDVAMLNDPFRGGTHLPDITLVAPVFLTATRSLPANRPQRDAAASRTKSSRSRTPNPSAPDFFVAARAHHADIGGTYAGSMGPCREIYQEGFRIPPVKIVRGGQVDRDLLALLLNNVRTPEEREGDLRAQLAACHTGVTRLRELCRRYNLARVQRAGHALLDYSEQMMRSFLATVPPGVYAAEDFLDDDGTHDEPLRIAVRITFPRNPSRARAVVVDFTGSSPQVEGSVNAVEAITYSACFYVFRCLLRDDVPATAGLMRPIQLIAPAGTIVNARPPAAVAGGNVETSQRIVDVLLRALAQALPDRIPAASSGTMNNLTIGGMDDRTGGPHSLRLLRDHRRRLGSGRRTRRRLRRAHSHDQLAEHAGRGAGVQLSVSRDQVCAAHGEWR